jgi:hypothetical protein
VSTNDVLMCNNDRAKWCKRLDERVRNRWEEVVGWIELYQQTTTRGRDERVDSRGAPEPAGTRHKRGVIERRWWWWWWWQEGQEGQQQGSSKASGCPGSAHIINTATEGAGEGARCDSIRCDALDTSQLEREEDTLSLTFPHTAHATTWMPTCRDERRPW